MTKSIQKLHKIVFVGIINVARGVGMNDIELMIRECNKCGNLPKLTCDTIKIGKSHLDTSF